MMPPGTLNSPVDSPIVMDAGRSAGAVIVRDRVSVSGRTADSRGVPHDLDQLLALDSRTRSGSPSPSMSAAFMRNEPCGLGPGGDMAGRRDPGVLIFAPGHHLSVRWRSRERRTVMVLGEVLAHQGRRSRTMGSSIMSR